MTIRFGLIGCGVMGADHARILRGDVAGAELVELLAGEHGLGLAADVHQRHVAVRGDQGRQVGEALRRGVRQRGEEPELGCEADGGAVLVRKVCLTAGQRGPDGAIKRMRYRA